MLTVASDRKGARLIVHAQPEQQPAPPWTADRMKTDSFGRRQAEQNDEKSRYATPPLIRGCPRGAAFIMMCCASTLALEAFVCYYVILEYCKSLFVIVACEI